MKTWKYSLSSADKAPSSAPILLRGSICDNLIKASRLGYNAIEVHTREDVYLDYEKIKKTIQETGIRISMIITGRLNTEGRCNLMDDAPYITEAAMNGVRKYIEMAELLGADIVIGWVKGNVPANGNREFYMERLAKNIRILAGYGIQHNVRLNLEVINRYEVNLFTTALETLQFINKYQLQNCYVHLDTFHMFIDEENPFEAILACKDRLGYLHLADNSRRYPGSSNIDFSQVLHNLEIINYNGYLSVECFPIPDGETAATRALEHMKKCEKSMCL